MKDRKIQPRVTLQTARQSGIISLEEGLQGFKPAPIQGVERQYLIFATSVIQQLHQTS